VALLTAWEAQLQQLFASSLSSNSNNPESRQQGTSTAWQQQQQGLQQQQLCLSGFLEFLQGRGAIPQLLEPADMQEVLRRLIAQQQDQVR
jgi:hypothetical protein